ncbi:MAG: hypothetical protein R2877_03940 [Bdellovibrionota bacterium]
MKYKYLILLLFLSTAQTAHSADNFDLTACKKEHGASRTVYRDEKDVVRCVNFGGKKAVEYSYNAIPDLVIGKQKYAEGALIGKKFYGFAGVPEGESQLVTSKHFHGTVLIDLFKSKSNQTLGSTYSSFYPSEKKQHDFINQTTEEYLSRQQKQVDPEFYERTFIEKLNYLQNEINQTNQAKPINPPLEELTTTERVKVRAHLVDSKNQKMSITQCNPTVAANYNQVFTDNMIVKRKMENSRLLAETNIFDNGIKIVLGTFMLENLMDKTIEETKPILNDEPMTEASETVNLRYNRDGSQDHDFPTLPVLSRVLVHELGHVHQFAMLRQPNNPFELYKIYINVAGPISRENEFQSVLKKLKNEIKTQIVEPLMGVFEYSAESYFVDAVPCIL